MSDTSSDSKEQDAKKPRGRTPNPQPTIDFDRLQWPASQERTKHRKRGSYHLKSVKSKLSAFERAKNSFHLLVGNMHCHSAVITWNAEKTQDITDPQFEEPGVAVHFQRSEKNHVIACDRYQTILANFRAVTERARCIHTLLDKEKLSDVIAIIERFHNDSELQKPKPKEKQTSLAVVKFEQPKIEIKSKEGLDPEKDWIEILELKPDELQEVSHKYDTVVLPINLDILKKAHKRLNFVYHTDREHVTDDGRSVAIVNSAYFHIKGFYEECQKVEADYQEELKQYELKHQKKKTPDSTLVPQPTEDITAEATQPEAAPVEVEAVAEKPPSKYLDLRGVHYPEDTPEEEIEKDQEKAFQNWYSDMKAATQNSDGTIDYGLKKQEARQQAKKLIEQDTPDESQAETEEDDKEQDPDIKELDFNHNPSIDRSGFDDSDDDDSDDLEDDTESDDDDLVDDSEDDDGNEYADEEEEKAVCDDTGYDSY